VKLQEGHPVDENLRPIKVGGETTALELSKDDVRVNNLHVNGTTSGVSASDSTKLPLAGGTMTGDITTDSNIVSTDLTIDDSGDITLDADGGEVYIKDGGNTVAEFTDAGGRPTLKLYEDASGGTDYGFLQTRVSGYTILGTFDDAGSDADLIITADGDLQLVSETGKFKMKDSNGEFSVTDSAYAGMILGYRCIGEDVAPATYTLTTSMVTIHSNATVRFIAPPSGNVEINFQAHYFGGNGSTVTLGISDNATYSALSAPSAQYEKVSFDVARFDDAILNQNWVITGLTAGDTYNYWIGAKTSSTVGTPTIKYGGDSAGENVPLIIKVTALPAAVSDFAVYG